MSVQEIGKMARAQLVAEEYTRASDALAAVKAECDEETRVLARMKKWGVVAAAVCAGLILCLLVPVIAENSHGYPVSMVIVLDSLLYVFFASVPVALSAFAPAGFIGMWRAINRSSWFVWGGGFFMLIVVVFLIYVPIIGGVFFFIGQKRRVKRSGEQVVLAEERYAAASRALG